MRPVPLQRPRLPIWVGGRWPHRPPFRRRVLTASSRSTPPTATARRCPRAKLAAVVDYVAGLRGGAPFDVAVEGATTAGADETGRIGAYAQAGLTWWVEALGWWRGDVPGAGRASTPVRPRPTCALRPGRPAALVGAVPGPTRIWWSPVSLGIHEAGGRFGVRCAAGTGGHGPGEPSAAAGDEGECVPQRRVMNENPQVNAVPVHRLGSDGPALGAMDSAAGPSADRSPTTTATPSVGVPSTTPSRCARSNGASSSA